MVSEPKLALKCPLLHMTPEKMGSRPSPQAADNGHGMKGITSFLLKESTRGARRTVSVDKEGGTPSLRNEISMVGF